jgi:hypothetical protein
VATKFKKFCSAGEGGWGVSFFMKKATGGFYIDNITLVKKKTFFSDKSSP